jgi:hypothetical protein
MMMTTATTLVLDLVDNGSRKSLIADSGKVYATGSVSREMLREAGYAAQRDGFAAILIGRQSWDVAALLAE